MSSPALDGKASGTSTSANSVVSGTLTTAVSGSDVIAFVLVKHTSTPTFTVSSISSANTTGWAQKYSIPHQFGTDFWNLEVWHGKATGTIAEAITANLSGTANRNVIVVFGVSGGATSFTLDDNAGSPYMTTNDPGSNSGTHNQVFSTANANDLLVEFFADDSGNVGFGATPDAGWTLSGENINFSVSLSTAVEAVSSVQSSVTQNIWHNYNAGTNSIWGVFAIQGPASTMTSTIAMTLGGITMALADTVIDPTAIAMTLGGITMVAAGSVANPVSETIAMTLFAPTMAAAGNASNPFGHIAMTLPGITLALTDVESEPAAIAMTLFKPTMVLNAFKQVAAGNPAYFSWWFQGP